MNNHTALIILWTIVTLLAALVVVGIRRVICLARDGNRYKAELMAWHTITIAIAMFAFVYLAFPPWNLHKEINLFIISIAGGLVNFVRHVKLDGRDPEKMTVKIEPNEPDR